MRPLDVTDESFNTDVLESELPVLLDFWATWCGPCRQIAPIVDELAKEYEGKLKVCKIDVDNNPQTAMKYGVRGIPTLLIINKGQEAGKISGAQPKAKIIQALLPVLQ